MTIRRLATGDEALLATLTTHRTLSDDEANAFLGDENTILLVAFARLESDVLWEFDYKAR